MQIINYYYWAINLVTGRTETFYSKAKIENRIKLMRSIGVEPSEQAFSDNF